MLINIKIKIVTTKNKIDFKEAKHQIIFNQEQTKEIINSNKVSNNVSNQIIKIINNLYIYRMLK